MPKSSVAMFAPVPAVLTGAGHTLLVQSGVRGYTSPGLCASIQSPAPTVPVFVDVSPEAGARTQSPATTLVLAVNAVLLAYVLPKGAAISMPLAAPALSVLQTHSLALPSSLADLQGMLAELMDRLRMLKLLHRLLRGQRHVLNLILHGTTLCTLTRQCLLSLLP